MNEITAYREDGRQLAWDNSSLSLLRTCPRKYYYEIVLGLRPQAQNPHLIFGSLYHAALEYNDRLIVDDIDLAMRSRLVCRYALRISYGWNSDHKMKTRERLVRAVMAYLDHFKTDGTETYMMSNGKPALELNFRFQSDEYMFCGYIDRIAHFNNELYVLDRKTTQKAFATDYIASFKPSGQMMQYTVGAQVGFSEEVKGVIIDVAYITANLDELGRFPVTYTKDQLAEWLENQRFWIGMAEQYWKAGKWPMNLDACHIYDGCKFRKLCSRPASVREHFIKAEYKVERWDPLKSREVE